MNTAHITLLRNLIARANAAGGDVGISTNVLTALLDEHDALVRACSTAIAAMAQMGNQLNWPDTIPQSYADAINALRAARALANGEDLYG